MPHGKKVIFWGANLFWLEIDDFLKTKLGQVRSSNGGGGGGGGGEGSLGRGESGEGVHGRVVQLCS